MTDPVLKPVLLIVLAAGKGTRMKSAMPKVMHKIGGRSMLGHVLAAAGEGGPASIAVVVGPGMDAVAREAVAAVPDIKIFMQHEQRGTADAVLAARDAIALHTSGDATTDVIVLYADTPLITADTVSQLRGALDQGLDISVLGFRTRYPNGYGRLLTDADGALLAIREDKDATAAERQIDLCNSGVMAFRVANLHGLLERISNSNAKSEYYLTDAVELARADGLRAGVVECAEDEVLGVNARDQLAAAEAIWQHRRRNAAMASGVTMVAPETVWLSFDTVLGRDVEIEPNVVFGLGVVVEDGAVIKAHCHIEGARIGAGARIGPFARLRPGADLGAKVHIGNFVEVKNTVMGEGAKANHLAYLGDGAIGAGANIGAGTIFCNYDGFNKAKTEIGANAFIGSNSSLVAPVKIGDGAYVGSGSVITKNVASGALALERSAQVEHPGWAAKFRTMMGRRKAKA